MKNILLILTNLKKYHYWKSKKNGKKYIDYKRDSGYYLEIGLVYYNLIGQIWETQMKSGKIGIYELIDYQTFRDPYDMIKYSYWNLIGYKNEKPIKECTFKEFLSIYN